MEKAVLPLNIGPEMERLFRHIFEEALGRIIDGTDLSADPTTANTLCKEGQIVFRSNALFFTFNGTTYKIAVTAV